VVTKFLDVEMIITENIDQIQTALSDLEMLMTENNLLLRSLNANLGQIFTLCKQEFAQQIALQE
jgi:hypothetical protein